jgi:hypothetical protein
MQPLPESGIQSALGWVQHTVRPVLRSVDSVGPAHQGNARGDVCSAGHARAGHAYQSGCFGGDEGVGCALSRAEQAVFVRVKNEPMSWED